MFISLRWRFMSAMVSKLATRLGTMRLRHTIDAITWSWGEAATARGVTPEALAALAAEAEAAELFG